MRSKPVSKPAAVRRRPARRTTVPRRRSRGRPGTSALSVGAEAIVLKACELLQVVPPRELSILKLARYAGVDRSLVRYYFSDRSSLLFAAARHLFGLLRSRLAVVEERLDVGPESRIGEMAVVLLRFQIEHPHFHRLLIDEVVNSPKREAQDFFRSFTAQGVATFRKMAAATARVGAARPFEGVFLYLAIIGMCEFFVTGSPILRIAFGADFDPAKVNGQYEDFLREYVVSGIRRR